MKPSYNVSQLFSNVLWEYPKTTTTTKMVPSVHAAYHELFHTSCFLIVCVACLGGSRGYFVVEMIEVSV